MLVATPRKAVAVVFAFRDTVSLVCAADDLCDEVRLKSLYPLRKRVSDNPTLFLRWRETDTLPFVFLAGCLWHVLDSASQE